jgi:hypothetical protein
MYKPHKWYFEESGNKKEQMDLKQQQIAESHLTFLNSLLTRGIALQQWKIAHSIVFFTDKSNQLLNKIRNIHLFEADYNAILKIQWGKAVQQAEKDNIIHPSEFGSLKNKTAHNPVLLKQRY